MNSILIRIKNILTNLKFLKSKKEFLNRFYHPLKNKKSYWAAPVSVAVLIMLLIASFLVNRNEFDQTKQQLVKNPHDLKANLVLAEELLANNQFEEAERVLAIAQNQLEKQNQESKKGPTEDFKEKLENLWLKKHYSDPEDISKLISLWEQITVQKPHYRDAYLQLAYLYYQSDKIQLAKQSLQQALDIDPNFELPKELKQTILP